LFPAPAGSSPYYLSPEFNLDRSPAIPLLLAQPQLISH
jgi:hypothetical protein